MGKLQILIDQIESQASALSEEIAIDTEELRDMQKKVNRLEAKKARLEFLQRAASNLSAADEEENQPPLMLNEGKAEDAWGEVFLIK